MKVYKLDEYSHEISLLDIKDDIETYENLLQCNAIDFATFASAPGEYRIVAVVDDLGAYTRKATCFYASGLSLLFGSIIFVRHYYDSPDFSDIQPEDLEIIKLCLIN